MLTPENIQKNILRSPLEKPKKISRKVAKPPEKTAVEETVDTDEVEKILAGSKLKIEKEEIGAVKKYIEADLIEEPGPNFDSEKKEKL